MDGRQFATHFQPVWDATSQSILGHEALARGPAGAWNSPLALFAQADEENCATELDMLFIELALTRFRERGSPGKLFVNVMPTTLFTAPELVSRIDALLANHSLSAGDIVLEITEHGPPREPAAILKAVEPLRELGCQIAIDDLGAGTSGLKIWSELRPEFVKIDRYFIDRIESDPVAAEMMRSLLDIAHVMGSRVIAEAVERASQCELLGAMGVDYLQGYFLGKPEPAPLQHVNLPKASTPDEAAPSMNRAEALLIARPAVSSRVKVEEVVVGFQQNRNWDCIVVVDDGRPLGIVRRDKLLTLLSKPLYPEIYNRKSISSVMEAHPLVVDARARLDQVSRLVTNSAESRVNEDFIIARHGIYLGIGRTIDLLRQITAQQLETAQQSNPLTLLPGNRRISEELFRLLALRTPFVVCHGDLDYFKPFNDEYGYRHGDQVLLHVADLFRRAANTGTDFVGHIGGDDFILMLRNVDWHARLRDLFESFSASIPNFYSDSHRAQGGFASLDRDGHEKHFPLLTLSIGAVLVDTERVTTQDQVLASLQHAKNLAKAEHGNALAYDRDGVVQMLSTVDASARPVRGSQSRRRATTPVKTDKATHSEIFRLSQADKS